MIQISLLKMTYLLFTNIYRNVWVWSWNLCHQRVNFFISHKVQVLDFSLFAISFLIFNYDLSYEYTKVVNHNCARHTSGKTHIKKCLLILGIFYKNRWTKFINKNRTKVQKEISNQWKQKRFRFTKRYLTFITRNEKNTALGQLKLRI